RGARELLGLTEPFHRCAQQELAPALGAIEQPFVESGSEHTRQNGVDADSVWRPFDRQGLCQCRDAGFARAIGGYFVKRDDPCQRSNVYDATVSALDHVPPENAERATHSRTGTVE